MATFKPSLITLAVIAASSISTVYAAEEEKEDKKKVEEPVEVIKVTGFRRSLIESINTKRYSASVVEAVSAEDIGKLPDSSIAESIARLPGLTAQRLDGRASKVSIRGFGENESATTFNGREQVSIGDNRGVEFDLYPSEIMSGVTVYKTPNATLEAEGIAGVVDMQTVSPLEEESRMALNGQLEKTSFGKLNPDGNNTGARATFSMIEKFAEDKVGFAFAASMMSSPNQEKRWNSWGYPEFTVDDQNYSILGGAKPFVRSSTLDRDSLMMVVEALPTDKLKLTFDALYVDFKDEKILRGIEIPFAWGQGSLSAQQVDAETGFVTQGQTEGQRVVVRNDVEEREAELKSFGFNAVYEINDDIELEFDASHSSVERQIWSLESYSGTGRGDSNGVADTLGYTFDGGNTGANFTHNLDYSDYNLIQLGGPLTWGWSSALNEKFNATGTEWENTAQDGFINAPTVDDELTSLKLAASQMVDSDVVSRVTYGVSHRSREKSKSSEGYFMTLNNFPGTLVVPEQYREGVANLDFIGMGNMVAYDSRGLINDGYFSLTQESLTNPSHATKSWSVSEDVMAAFVMADIDAEVGGMPLTGNAGLRYVKTEQSSIGYAFSDGTGIVPSSLSGQKHDYSHFLPSLNLALKIDDEQSVRFGYAKTISRARLDQMNASVSTGYSQVPDDNGNNFSVSGGNPMVEPKEATGIDLTYENYFSDEGYFSIAYFTKDLESWIFNGTYEVELNGQTIPGSNEVPANQTASGSGPVNGGGGDLSGLEFSITYPLNMISDALDGTGVIASYTKVDSDMKDQNGNEYQLPGLSDSIFNATVYYEMNGFQARVSMRKRDDFKGDVYGLGFDTVQVDIVGETIYDAQIGYDFGEAGYEGALGNLSVFLQAQNIGKEPFTSLQGDNALQVRDYQDYGSTYLLGFSYKF